MIIFEHIQYFYIFNNRWLNTYKLLEVKIYLFHFCLNGRQASHASSKEEKNDDEGFVHEEVFDATQPLS